MICADERGLTFSRKKGLPGVPWTVCSAKRQREARGLVCLRVHSTYL
jgi:hypothetical protein